MQGNHKEFWRRLQHDVEVVVASRDSEQLLGVREGFRRYFLRGLRGRPPISVRSAPDAAESLGLSTSSEETMAVACGRAEELSQAMGGAVPFCVAGEEGVATVEVDGVSRSFLVCWVAVSSPIGEACGGGGPIEIPERFTTGLETRGRASMPATRRRGGMLGSLTGGREFRREAFSLAAFHALSSLFFGLVEPPRESARWSD